MLLQWLPRTGGSVCLPACPALAPHLPAVSWAPGTSRPSLLRGANVWLQFLRNNMFKSLYCRMLTLNNFWSVKSIKINSRAFSCSCYLVSYSLSSCVIFFVDDVLVPSGEQSRIVTYSLGVALKMSLSNLTSSDVLQSAESPSHMQALWFSVWGALSK